MRTPLEEGLRDSQNLEMRKYETLKTDIAQSQKSGDGKIRNPENRHCPKPKIRRRENTKTRKPTLPKAKNLEMRKYENPKTGIAQSQKSRDAKIRKPENRNCPKPKISRCENTIFSKEDQSRHRAHSMLYYIPTKGIFWKSLGAP